MILLMQNGEFIIQIYQAIDRKDSRGMMQYLTDDSVFRFANIPQVEGRDNITAFLDGFFASIKSLRHTGIEYWNSGNAWFVTGNVTYTRHDGSTLGVPFAVLLKMKAELVRNYLIFVDASELYK